MGIGRTAGTLTAKRNAIGRKTKGLSYSPRRKSRACWRGSATAFALECARVYKNDTGSGTARKNRCRRERVELAVRREEDDATVLTLRRDGVSEAVREGGCERADRRVGGH